MLCVMANWDTGDEKQHISSANCKCSCSNKVKTKWRWSKDEVVRCFSAKWWWSEARFGNIHSDENLRGRCQERFVIAVWALKCLCPSDGRVARASVNTYTHTTTNNSGHSPKHTPQRLPNRLPNRLPKSSCRPTVELKSQASVSKEWSSFQTSICWKSAQLLYRLSSSACGNYSQIYLWMPPKCI